MKNFEEQFESKFGACFNVGVVPDDMTKENIKQFFKDYLTELAREVVGKETHWMTDAENEDPIVTFNRGIKLQRSRTIDIFKKHNIIKL